jgi:hypothetical protein
MFRKTVYSFLTIVLWLGLSAYAQNIVWISETNADADSVYFDQGWIDLLEAEGYTVDFRPGEWMDLDTDKLATLESADLIIASRNSNSGNYATDPTEVTQWNSIPTPLIMMTAYWCRNNRWLWINDTNINEYAPEAMMQVVDSAHPVFEGIKPVDGLVDVIDETVNDGQNSFILTNDVGNGMLIAQRADNQAVWIAEWAPDVEFYDGSGQIPAEKRMLFLAGGGGGQEAGSFNLNDEGTQIFLNAVKYMTGAESRVKAFGPNPDDGALIGETWVTFSWTPGDFAVSHDVYLGDDFDAVSNATPDSDLFRGNQITTFFTAGFPGFPYPEGLVPGTTYYWRIDEVNAPPDATVFKGEVWSFSVPPKTAYNPNPANNAEAIGPDNVTLSWTGGYGSKLHTVYIGNDYDEVNNAVGGMMVGSATYNAGSLDAEKVYYWRVDEFDGVDTYKGDVWTFTTPGAVSAPQPFDGATNVSMTTSLRWTAATNATSHQVYLGLDKDVVRNADTGAPEYQGSASLGSEIIDPGKLALDTVYYWRVDAVYNAGPVKGPIWSFTTADFLIVDDFESYTDDDIAGEAVWQHWIDGFGIADNGAQAGYLVPPYCEQKIVHGGGQSMPLIYDNTPPISNSEAVLTLTDTRDWTAEGVDELSIWFRGNAANGADPLYVSIANASGAPALMANENINAAQVRAWTQWMISLQAFADQGINLTNVNEISIGLGNKGGPPANGIGTVFIDDIALYRSAP